jgi:CheY-like chemotaxis protein
VRSEPSRTRPSLAPVRWQFLYIYLHRAVYRAVSRWHSGCSPRCCRGGAIGSPMSRPPLVLLIDDDRDIRLTYADILGDDGVVVAQAGDGRDGFQRAIETPPDLIITDITMPIMDGWELLRRLRTDERTRHIPVIVCSGRERSGVQLEMEPNAYLVKPCDLEELRLEVRRLLGRPAA